MKKDILNELIEVSNSVREQIIISTYNAKSGHPGGSLSAADYLTFLYCCVLNHTPDNPKNEARDRFVLSKGHAAPALYAVLAIKGYFEIDEMIRLRKIDSILQGHPSMNCTPGIDMSTGSLGQGISAAAGMAKGAQITGRDINVYCLLGDGELDEGQVWESLMFSSHHELDNLCVAVDCNGLQIEGKTDEVMKLNSITDKFTDFGFSTIEINGHSFDELEKAFNFFYDNKGSKRPTAIIMHTIKGKGVSFMENKLEWHGKAPNVDECKLALEDIRSKKVEG